MGFRIFSLLFFGDSAEILEHQGELPKLFQLALRFDLKTIALIDLLIYWLPSAVASWWLRPEVFRRYLRSAFAGTLTVLTLLECINLGYRIFFGGPIDVLIFGFLEDGTSAVMSTLTSDGRIISIYFLFAVLATATVFCFIFTTRDKQISPISRRRFLITETALLVVLCLFARGSLDTFPLRSANASVGNSFLINSLIVSSSYNLNQAFIDRVESVRPRSMQSILKEGGASDIDELYNRAGYADKRALIATTGRKTNPLPHVIMVQMEGWSTEIILGNSETNQILGEFSKHINQDHFFTNFFSNAYGTNPTIEALLLNSPVTPLSQSQARSTRFSMSNVLPFKRAGYRIAFISGGDSAWRNQEKFWLTQGFDSYTGRASIEKNYRVDASDNPWGVYDEFVFAAVEDAIKAAESDGVPLFAYVLTTNNHSPIRLPKTYRAPPLDPSAYGFAPNDTKKFTDLTGFNYQTDQFGKFMSWVKTGVFRDKTIVAATGDHILKGFTNYNSLERSYLRYAVPAYFYAPQKLDRLRNIPETTAGSHEDIFPTLFELALSEADYFGFGSPMTKKNTDQSYGWILSKDFIFPQGFSSNNSKIFFPWADNRQRTLLKTEGRKLEKWQSDVMFRENYRRLLKEHLLWQDYEKQK